MLALTTPRRFSRLALAGGMGRTLVESAPGSAGQTSYTGPCPDLDAAVRARKLRFDQVCEAYFGQHDASDQALRDEYKRLYPLLQSTFSETTKGASLVYFTQPITGLRSGAAQTGDNNFHLIYDTGLCPSNTVFLLSRLDQLKTGSHVMLSGRSRAEFTELAYAAATNIFALMEYQAKTRAGEGQVDKEDLDNRVRVCKSSLRDLASILESASQTQARLDYSLGMLIGMALLATIVLFLNWLVPTVGWLPDTTAHFLFYTMLAGGIGAVISVISRASSLRLDYHVGHFQLGLFGIFRPVVGGVFGFVVCALIRSKVINFAAPPDPSESLFYYAGAAFLAGFSERLAPGILESAGRRLTVPAAAMRESE